MSEEPNQTPDGGTSLTDVGGTGGPKYAGLGRGAYDATVQPGQYPPGMAWERELFGVAIPQNTGAPGTRGAQPGGADPTNQPGQLTEGISGEGPAQTADTGAPGSAGARNSEGGGETPVTYTLPGSYLDGTYRTITGSDEFSGPEDSTQANDDGYATGGPQLPGLRGNEPEAGRGRYQPSGGGVQRDSAGGLPGSSQHILRGGRGVRG